MPDTLPAIPGPDEYKDPPDGRAEGVGFEDPDAGLAGPPAEPIDWSDPDAKLAWVELLAEATEAGDDEAVAALKALAPPAE